MAPGGWPCRTSGRSGRLSRSPAQAPPAAASLGGASWPALLRRVLPVVEEVGGSWAQVRVVAKSPPSKLPRGGFLGGGASTQARQQRSPVDRPTGCRGLHLPQHAGGWPPTHATCQETWLPQAPCPTFYQSLVQRQSEFGAKILRAP